MMARMAHEELRPVCLSFRSQRAKEGPKIAPPEFPLSFPATHPALSRALAERAHTTPTLAAP